MSVQSINRALLILNEVGKSSFTTITHISRNLGLARATVARISDTLIEAGYLHRNIQTKRISLGRTIKHLNHLYSQVGGVRDSIEPILEEYSSRMRWPMTISRPRQGMMEIIATTCHQNPYAFERPLHGHQFSLLESASGIAFLAALEAEKREEYIFLAQDTWGYPSRASITSVQARIQEAIEVGHSLFQKDDAREAVLARAILSSHGPIGAVGIRFIRSAVAHAEFYEQIKPLLESLAEALTGVLSARITIGQVETTSPSL